jgi:hypothetical protein
LAAAGRAHRSSPAAENRRWIEELKPRLAEHEEVIVTLFHTTGEVVRRALASGIRYPW